MEHKERLFSVEIQNNNNNNNNHSCQSTFFPVGPYIIDFVQFIPDIVLCIASCNYI